MTLWVTLSVFSCPFLHFDIIDFFYKTQLGTLYMESIENNEILVGLCKEYNIELPNNLQNMKVYEEIKNFKDSEYVYCIAYEMLIRTDEYNALLKEYEPLKDKSKGDMSAEEFLKLNELIGKMNDLGLRKTSFLGFDCDDGDGDGDSDHVFKRIACYDEVTSSPWSVRMVHKFQIDPSLGFNSIYHMLLNFYGEKNKLYGLLYGKYIKIPTKSNKENQNSPINNIHITEIYKAIDAVFIPYVSGNNIEYKLLKDIKYLKELDKDFLSLLKEKQNSDLLIQIKSDFSHNNIEFWNKYCVNDIKDGLNKLVEYHLNNNLIYDQNIKHVALSKNDILKNPSNFYIPCVNRTIEPKNRKWDRTTSSVRQDRFIKQLEFNGLKSIVGNGGYITLREEENIYLVQISEYIPLILLDDLFLETLKYENLKNTYIATEPLFSRPRLMFDEARLVNIPINLNLSKEDLLFYISQIKDEYEMNRNIVKTHEEYFFNLTTERDFAKMPGNIKYAYEKRDSKLDKKVLPKKREEFKKNLAMAFYAYDLYKFFIPLFEKKRKFIRNERDLQIRKEKESRGSSQNSHNINEIRDIANEKLKNYQNNNLITQISYLVKDFSEEQLEYYLRTMKEFIHGTNEESEESVLKKQYNSEKKDNPDPKYKSFIIGDSNIVKTNKVDLLKALFG